MIGDHVYVFFTFFALDLVEKYKNKKYQFLPALQPFLFTVDIPHMRLLTLCPNFSPLHPATYIPLRPLVYYFILFFYWCVCVYAVVEIDLLLINCCPPLLLSATANLHQHQFTRYHQAWLADNVQKEEESCKQWFLQSSPDVGNVREEEEQGQVCKMQSRQQ